MYWPMHWRSYLQTKTRQPAFLWRMVLGIIAAGMAVGFVVQHFSHPSARREVQVAVDSWPRVEQLARQAQWWQLWWAIPKIEWDRSWPWGTSVLAGLTGCCWLVFVLQALQVRDLHSKRLGLALAGVLLGVLSIWPTDFFILWQEYGWGLQDGPSLAQGLRYNVLGVGLREETAKLMGLLPLLLLLLRWGDELAALLVSACVGIGFALVENAGYFAYSGGSDVLGRFLTANPMHMTLTGLVGLAVYQGLRDPRTWGPQAAAMFGLMVFAHGFYDATLTIAALADYSILGTILFALLVYQFFHELRQLRSVRGETISLTANFLFGVSLVTAATFVYLSATVGSAVALDMLAEGVLSLAVMVYLFLREMPESMIRL